MPAKRRLTVRQLRQMLRLAGSGTSSREIAVVLGIARSTVQDNLQRAAAVGLSWPLPGELTDDALENKLFSRNGVRQGTRRHTEPNWADLRSSSRSPASLCLSSGRNIAGRIPKASATVASVNCYGDSSSDCHRQCVRSTPPATRSSWIIPARRSRSSTARPARSARRRSSWRCWVPPDTPLPRRPGRKRCPTGLARMSGCFGFSRRSQTRGPGQSEVGRQSRQPI